MISRRRVPLDRLIVAFSRTLDLVHPEIQEHHLRVAYVSTHIARHIGLSTDELLDLFLAASLHDIGMTRINEVASDGCAGDQEKASWHAEVGCELLRHNPLLANAAQIIRCHHVRWAGGRGHEWKGQTVPLASNIIALAEEVERVLDFSKPILQQMDSVVQWIHLGGDEMFVPQVVDVFRDCASEEAFWLDSVSKKIEVRLLESIDSASVVIDEHALQSIAEILAHLVDGMSPWTATHSAGVAGVSFALAELLKFGPRERSLMRTAGYLHDLGKLSVAPAILDKGGALTDYEWAILKGHTYHTYQILDAIGGSSLCEWAAFHHERLDGKGYPFHPASCEMSLGTRVMCVADVFAALTEDRPYRQGTSPSQALTILENMAAEGGLDGDIVGLLRRDCDVVVASCEREQAGRKQQHERFGEFIRNAAAA